MTEHAKNNVVPFDAAAAARKVTADIPEPPSVDITNTKTSYRDLINVMLSDTTPPLYSRGGHIAWIRRVRGAPVIECLGKDNLLSWFGDHVDTYKVIENKKEGTSYKSPAFPSTTACAAILGKQDIGLPELHGVVTHPVVRADGSLLQVPGYDEPTGLYLDPQHTLPEIPSNPTKEQLTRARELLVNEVLADFPFVRDSDRAQYVAGLMAPILRPYAPGVTPMLAISAASPGTGKSYLSYEVFNALYGAQSLTWTSNEEELRKLISTKLRESSGGAMVFDNVPGGYSVRSPVLAQLMTSESWEDRALGSNSSIVADNNRLWIINGNNIRTGEDMARRTLWVRLDANCPRPETRSIDGFKVGDLKAWLARGNAPRLLEALLTLAAGWIAAGAPREDHPLGGYSGWTSVMGGFLSWANIPGFLANREEEADGQDADAEMWIEVLTTWRERFGGQAKSVRSVMMDDEMASVLPKGRGGAPLESRELAWKFRSIMGRYYGDFRLVKAERAGSSKKPAEWRVESLT